MVYQRTYCDLRHEPDARIAVRCYVSASRDGNGNFELVANTSYGSDFTWSCTVEQARQLATDILDALGGAGSTLCDLCKGAGHFDDVECPRCGGTGVAK